MSDARRMVSEFIYADCSVGEYLSRLRSMNMRPASLEETERVLVAYHESVSSDRRELLSRIGCAEWPDWLIGLREAIIDELLTGLDT